MSDNANVTASGGAETSTPSSASATPAQATPGASAAAAPATSSAAPAQQSATQTGPEGWVPSYRIRDTRQAVEREWGQKFTEAEQRYASQIEQLQNQLRALVGVTPPKNPEVDAVRQQFGSLYPGLAKLEEQAAQIEALLERAQDFNTQSEHYWQSYGRQTMDRLFDMAAKDLGAPLTEAGKRALHKAFVGHVQSDEELATRYSQDPTIVEDFWKDFSSNFVDPARRAASAAVATRAASTQALPQDKGGSPPPVSQPPKPKDLDERSATAWARFEQLRQQG